ncbi:potassium-transporting ATPase subunit KdpC [Nocardioidaceae bacterium]|nr:potassium-transporting ATPase subunit KdpC [Nocardioidaceae bacterium]
MTLLSFARQCSAGLRVLLLMTVVLGVLYPLTVTGIAQVAFPWQAEGSLVTATGERTEDPDRAVGSALLGQVVDDAGLFMPRPSAAGEGYDPLATSGSNLGPENPELLASVEDRLAGLAAREGVRAEEVPADAVTASASGLDPHISPEFAALQVPRVADAQGLREARVSGLVEEHTQARTFGVLGEPRVDVLGLNIAVRALADDAG